MPIAKRYVQKYAQAQLRDTRPVVQRVAEEIGKSSTATIFFAVLGIAILIPPISNFADAICAVAALYGWWQSKRKFNLPLKLPAFANQPDPNNTPSGKSGPGKSEGILFLGNDKDTGEELWVTNSDARTHILYLGTTGAGKTEGLKAIATNALTWGSGFCYTDGKADSDLFASLFSLTRRFGRDDDFLVLNYMTGNSDTAATSNTMNPFVFGSASYLTNLLVGLMDDSGGDNAMWKGRAISLVGALMPALTFKRDNQGMLLSIGIIRDHLTLQAVIRLSRDPTLPAKVTRGLQSYLETLPGFIPEAFDDEGTEVPLPPDRPPIDNSIPRQQHGYLSMQFTRALQSLADEYGYIFGSQNADIDMVEMVLNRRILVVLIPSLEKSDDEAANLGKIVAASMKGMMGATLGAQIEGDWGGVIDNKVTNSESPYITVFDEVGYYTAQGMAVMAAQARSLGFSLVFAAQDLPAMEKRVKEEARSITGNCNIKIFGKLEDPTGTREFFDKRMTKNLVAEVGGQTMQTGVFSPRFNDQQSVNLAWREKMDFGDLTGLGPGQSSIIFGQKVLAANMFLANAGKVKALRINRFLGIVPPVSTVTPRDRAISEVSRRFADADWTAASGVPPLPISREVEALRFGYDLAGGKKRTVVECGAMALAHLATLPPLQEAVAPDAKGDAEFDPFAAPGSKDTSDFDLKSFWESLPSGLTETKSAPAASAPPVTSPPPPPLMPESPPSVAPPPSLEKLADDFFAKHFGNKPGEEDKNKKEAATPESPKPEAPKEEPQKDTPYVMPPSVEALLKKSAETLEKNLFSKQDKEKDKE